MSAQLAHYQLGRRRSAAGHAEALREAPKRRIDRASHSVRKLSGIGEECLPYEEPAKALQGKESMPPGNYCFAEPTSVPRPA